MRKPTYVSIRTATVGQNFGTVAKITSAATGKKLAETQLRPYGNDGAAMRDAETLCEERGYAIVRDE